MSNAVSAISWDYPTPFICPLVPQAEDIDGLQHVNNAVYVRWCEQVAWAHSNSLGLGIDDYRRLNRAVAIRRSEYDYLRPAYLSDNLHLATWLTGGDGKLYIERSFQLVRPADGATLMRGRWDIVVIELSTGRPCRMPPEFGAYVSARVARQGF